MMPRRKRPVCAEWGPVLAAGLAFWLAGCEPWHIAAGGTAGAVGLTATGGLSPAQEIEQVYYLGVFDPQEQMPATVYRVTVHGQASVISGMKFASGWAPAELIDSLNTHAGFRMSDPNDPGLHWTGAAGPRLSHLKTGRRLVLFGPEGFREAPKDHRLVIVMGHSPDGFFKALEQTLGEVSGLMDERVTGVLRRELLEAMLELEREARRLDGLDRDVEMELAK